MTRKAIRKRLREQAKQSARTAQRASSRWIATGAFVASAALASAPATAAPAAPFDTGFSAGASRSRLVAVHRTELYDPRLALVEDVFRFGMPLPRNVTAANQAQSSTAQQDQSVRLFAIPAGPLETVIKAFEAATGITVAVSTDSIRPISSPGVSGTFTIQQALQQLLAGTNVTFRFTGPAVATLELRIASESVNVTADAPLARVASPKFTAPLRDIPQTINVIPSQLLEQQGATTLRDALRNVSGITFQAGEGGTPAGDQMTIRGFSARTDMFIDGVRDIGGYARDTFNLQQVEVAKGPSSAIAGRGSTGASVNLVSKLPGATQTFGAALEGGNADHKRLTADLNQPFGPMDGALRMNVMWTDSGVPGRDIVRNKSWGLAPTVTLGLTRSTRVTVGYLHLHQNNLPDYGLPWVPATNKALAAFVNGRPPVDRSNFYGLVNRDYEHVNNDIASATVERTFGSFSLRNLTRYGKTYRDSIITSPRFASDNASTVRRTDVKSRDQDDNIVSNQTNLQGRLLTRGVQHDVVLGTEFAREAEKNYTRTETGPDNPVSPNTDLFNPNPFATYTGKFARTGAYTDGRARSAGLYAFDTAHLGARWELTGGLRWDYFDVDYTSVAANGVGTPLSRADKMVSGRGGVVFKPTRNGSVYGAVATSFNPSAEGLALTTSTVNLEPEKTRNYEVGTKWDLRAARAAVSAALFRTEKTNSRTPGINPGDPPTVLAGEQVVQGVEFGVSGSLTQKWSGFASYSLMDSEIARSNTVAEVDASLTLTPKSTFNFWTTYDLGRGFTLGGGAQYMDAVFRNTTNTTVVPSYWVANALASYDVNTHLTLRLNATNIGDTDYVDRTSGGHFIPGPARAVLLSTTFKF